MTELLTSAQMRAVEQRAIAQGDVTGGRLMARAGEGAVAALLEAWPDLHAGSALPGPRVAVVLCGPGNNGGDGYVMAGHLAARGWAVHLHGLGAVGRASGDAVAARRAWEAGGGSVLDWTPGALAATAARCAGAGAILVVDALFGIGLSRPLEAGILDPWAAFMAGLAEPKRLCLCAVDVPSGVSDAMPQGRRLAGFDDPRRRRLTVTFHRLKVAHRAMRDMAEPIRVVDIGLPRGSVT